MAEEKVKQTVRHLAGGKTAIVKAHTRHTKGKGNTSVARHPRKTRSAADTAKAKAGATAGSEMENRKKALSGTEHEKQVAAAYDKMLSAKAGSKEHAKASLDVDGLVRGTNMNAKRANKLYSEAKSRAGMDPKKPATNSKSGTLTLKSTAIPAAKKVSEKTKTNGLVPVAAKTVAAKTKFGDKTAAAALKQSAPKSTAAVGKNATRKEVAATVKAVPTVAKRTKRMTTDAKNQKADDKKYGAPKTLKQQAAIAKDTNAVQSKSRGKDFFAKTSGPVKVKQVAISSIKGDKTLYTRKPVVGLRTTPANAAEKSLMPKTKAAPKVAKVTIGPNKGKRTAAIPKAKQTAAPVATKEKVMKSPKVSTKGKTANQIANAQRASVTKAKGTPRKRTAPVMKAAGKKKG
jgi:hypothetical protein